jgi:signal transduction histidine kinase
VELSFHLGADGTGRIHVLDTGVGIAPEKCDRLFVPFDRLGAESTNVEGTGLGLSLSRRLVEVMDGEMGLLKSDSEGSVFYIQLPMTSQPSGAELDVRLENATVWRQSA